MDRTADLLNAMYDSCLQQRSLLADRIQSEAQQIVSQIQETRLALSRVPVFNFTKRNALKKKEAALLNQFSVASDEIVSAFLDAQSAKIKNTNTISPKEQEHLSEVKKQRALIKSNLEEAYMMVQATKACQDLFSATLFPDLRTSLSKQHYALLENQVSQYQAAVGKLAKIQKDISNNETILRRTAWQLSELQESLPDKSQSNIVTQTINVLDTLSYNNVISVVLDENINALFDKYHVKRGRSNYRFMLYLQLLFCSLYFSKAYIQDSFVNIDEAQDLALTEYQLLRNVLGANCVFNLYGDVNQLVYSYKGISDWDDLADIVGNNTFVLNENYRNTVQITQFCNEEFGADVYPIGISGNNVTVFPLMHPAIEWAKNCLAADPGKRIAILIGNEQRSDSSLKETALKEGFSWMQIDLKKVSVITVEMAKGLEFDEVLAFKNKMSENERYIAYTRALDSLAVVS